MAVDAKFPRNTHIVMEALARLNREFGLTVLCNLHSVDLARTYCGRLVGMAAGRVVFDGPPAALTPAAVQQLYGMAEDGPTPAPGPTLPLGPEDAHHPPATPP